MQNLLICVDLSNMAHRAYHALPDPSRVTDLLRHWLGALKNEYRPDELKIALDAPGSSWRAELCPDYKAQRNAKPAELRQLLEGLPAALKSWNVTQTPGYEADDILAAWAKAHTLAGEGRA